MSAAQKQLLAATELQQYIEKISGARLPMVSETQEVGGAVVLVGAGKKATAMNLPIPAGVTPDRKEEGYLIYATKDVLVLAGNDEGPYVGTFYAVSEFLNRQGVRWFMPGDYLQGDNMLDCAACRTWGSCGMCSSRCSAIGDRQAGPRACADRRG